MIWIATMTQAKKSADGLDREATISKSYRWDDKSFFINFLHTNH